MTTEEYLNKDFKSGDTVKVILNDGTERVIVLDRSGLYTRPPITEYPSGRIIPGGEPNIIVHISLSQSTRPEGEGIPISLVQDVMLF
jgi:hypothetical protein